MLMGYSHAGVTGATLIDQVGRREENLSCCWIRQDQKCWRLCCWRGQHGGDVSRGVCDLCRSVTREDALAGGAPGVP